MTDRDILVRDMVVHRYMDRQGIPSGQEQYVKQRYWIFRQHNRDACEYVESLAVNTGGPQFIERLERLTKEFSEWTPTWED